MPGVYLIATSSDDLLGRDADLARLAAQLAPDLKQNRSQPVGDAQGVDLGLRHIVNWVNDS